MNSNGVTTSDILPWIEESLKSESLVDYEVTLTGKSDKGDGYLGEIVFLTVSGTTRSNGKKSLNFVIKHAKSNEHLRKTVPVRQAFETEIHIYDKVLPIFTKFQLENNIQNIFSSVPKCYQTLTMDNMEVLVLDNLKKRGYELHDRKKPLNFDHIKTVLTEYGKFHALSFALRDQRKEEFIAVTADRPDVFVEFLINEDFREVFQKVTDDALDLLQERQDLHLLEKFRNLVTKNPCDMFVDLLKEEEPQAVIVHGDSWNNNFLFKYENDDRGCPSKVAILDWQISTLRSPAFDLAYHIYATSSKEELYRFDELLDIYYTSFSNFLKELGSNPDQLFSYSDLKRHWKKYSVTGLLLTPMILKFELCSKEDAPSFEDLQEGDKIGDMMDINITEMDLYYERLRDVFCHYFEYSF